MITHLRDRNRADRFLNDVRANQKTRRNYGRYVYLTAVSAVFLYLLNLAFGHYFWLQAEGLVVSDHLIVASPYEIQVTEMIARPGMRVREGEKLAQIHSPQVADTIATLSAQGAETFARMSEIAIRLEVVEAMMQLADQRFEEAEERVRRVGDSRGKTGFVSDAFIAELSREHYAAKQEKAVREAERRASIAQLEKLSRSIEEAEASLNELRASYNDGIVLARADGVIGPKVAVEGDVIQPGTHLMELYVGPKYAYVYLDTGTLHRAGAGDRVWVADGFNSTKGTISEVLPLTVPLPVDFQRAFRPPSRGQVARIELDDEEPFPMSSKIRITGDKLIPGNDYLTRTAVQTVVTERISSLRNFAMDAIESLRSTVTGIASRQSPTVAQTEK
jgi:multidrug resistance efflux pump